MYQSQVEEQEYFNWKCLVCCQVTQSPMHLEMLWLVTYGPQRWLYKMGKMWQVFLPVPRQLLTKCNRNPYWSLSLYIFRLQAVIFSYFSPIYLYLFVYY